MTADRESRQRRLAGARLYLVTPALPAAGPLDEFLPRVLEAGVDVVQLRDKTLEAAPLLEVAAIVQRRAEEFGALFIVNDRVDLAIAAGADGVHVGQCDLSPSFARRLMGPDALIGLSTHTVDEVLASFAPGATGSGEADYIAVGPIFSTPTKPGRPAVGLDLVQFTAEHAARPFFAIGGLDAATLPEAAAAGARRIAVVRALTDAVDPVAATRTLLRVLDRYGAELHGGRSR